MFHLHTVQVHATVRRPQLTLGLEMKLTAGAYFLHESLPAAADVGEIFKYTFRAGVYTSNAK